MIRPIKTETDYRGALRRIEALMDAEPGTEEGDELDVLATLVESYESEHYPMDLPSPVAAIQFRMDQAGLTARDLVPFIGSRAKVSEVLSGKRPLSLQMIRALHQHLGIPADALLGKEGSALPETPDGMDWTRFPLKAMAKLEWIKGGRDLADRAEEVMRHLIDRAGGYEVLPATLYRKNDRARQNAKNDPYALKAWCLVLLARAREQTLPGTYREGVISVEFMRTVARLSWSKEGPRLAQEFLGRHGIHLIVLPHLPRTHLDGAAMCLPDGTPVIGLTLRYDRIDNFWFCLLHELAHVGRHLRADCGEVFLDDLDLSAGDPKEKEADDWAEEALIPHALWQNHPLRLDATPNGVIGLAQELQVHPAIIAGRVRHDKNNYRLLSQFVGNGEVRRLFPAVHLAE